MGVFILFPYLGGSVSSAVPTGETVSTIAYSFFIDVTDDQGTFEVVPGEVRLVVQGKALVPSTTQPSSTFSLDGGTTISGNATLAQWATCA